MKTFTRPNVLLIYTDQQRQDSIGSYGNPYAKTPNIDKLASEGTQFNQFFVQNPVCSPSRMSFLTGRYCSSLGIGMNGIAFPSEDAVTLNQLLQPYGYNSGQIGKLHFQPTSNRDHRIPYPSDYGFDTFITTDDNGCYEDAYIKWVETLDPTMVDKVWTCPPPAAIKNGVKNRTNRGRGEHEPYLFEGDEEYTHSSFIAQEVCQYLKRQQQGPFFAIAGFVAPHAPINPPKRFVDMYDPSVIPFPKVGENERIGPKLKDISPERWQEIIVHYLAHVSHVDECVGHILETLQETGLADNTIVIFSSDHGEYLGDHGRIGKAIPHDCIMRVPYIMKYPKHIPAGQVMDELTEAVDMVPTVLEYCGIQIPPYVQGLSLKPLIEGKVEQHREDVFAEVFNPYGHRGSMVRTAEYKYLCEVGGEEFFFDLTKDPDELNNVIDNGTYSDAVSDMRKRLIRRMQHAMYSRKDRVAEY